MTAVVLPFVRRAPALPVQPEIVADLLWALEDAPLFTPWTAVARGLGGVPVVAMAVAGRDFRLTPQDARLAADALFAEQAFVGCVEVADALRAAADLADRMRRVG